MLLRHQQCAGTLARSVDHHRLDGRIDTAHELPDGIRYTKSGVSAWRTQSVSVRIRPHVLEVVGPIPTLRALQAALAGPADAPLPAARPEALSNRETVAGAIQISDNAERVAGMAE